LILWFVIGMVVYVSYGMTHSKLAQPASDPKNSPSRNTVN
jgi:hypothetical protein